MSSKAAIKPDLATGIICQACSEEYLILGYKGFSLSWISSPLAGVWGRQ